MARRSNSDNQPVPDGQAIEQIEQALEGGPVRFDLAGVSWSLRQPTPAELTRIRLAYDVGRHRAWQDLQKSELSPADVESAVASAMKVGFLTALREKSEDDDERHNYAEQITSITAKDPTSAFDQITAAYATAERDAKALDLLLEAPTSELRREFLASAAIVDEARVYVHQVLILASTVPNLTARQG